MIYGNSYLVYGYGLLERAIVHRSLDQTKHALLMEKSLARSFKGKLSPLELAIGWPKGLRMLLEVGFDAFGALRLSIDMGDLTSTQILLDFSNFPEDSVAGWSQVMHDLTSSSDQEIRQFVIQSLRARRQALSKLATKTLPKDDLLDLGLLNEKTLDVAALKVYQRLLERSVNVPLKLNPASGFSRKGSHLTVYHSVFSVGSLPDIGLLDCLFENGFECIDALNEEWNTPLLMMCRKSTRNRLGKKTILLVDWLLSKGACPKFSFTNSNPNIIFYLATCLARNMRDSSQDYDKYLRCLIRRSASQCSPLDSDSCQCYCSYSGCLPFHNFWRCGNLFIDHQICRLISRDTLFNALNVWLDMCGLDDTQSEVCYEEVCRLEVFDRLGLVHTCCAFQDEELLTPEVDRKEVQEEDKELNVQLDLTVHTYRNGREKYTGNPKNFWKNWMLELDEILPELAPQERCRFRCSTYVFYDDYKMSAEYAEDEAIWHDHRSEVEEKALARKGYLGLDFVDVIKLHFADYLNP